MEQVKGLIAQLGAKRLIIMGGVAALIMAALAMVALRGENTTMGFLYTDLDPSAAAAISEKLKSQNVPFELSADGTAVMAPVDKLAELRMAMAGEKLGGKIGYDVLDEEQPFGVSASRAKMNETRAIEGELVRSIQSLDAVSGARVHIVMPERAMFAAEARPATASVTVKTKGRLPAETIQAIRYLVSSAVPELSPESVSIVDQSGALLARAGEQGAAGGGSIDERQSQIEAKMREEIVALLEPIVGQGKVRAEVAAQIDRDATREESNVYDPDKQVIARQVTVESDDQTNENSGEQAATVGNQLPEAQQQPVGANGGDTRQQARKETSEDVTYANSATRSVVTREPGKLTRLSVAVTVDGGAQGLPEARKQQLTRLVENAVGIDTERGDSVVVESLAFATPAEPADAQAAWYSFFTSDQVVGLLKILLVGVIGLIVLRMLRSRANKETEGEVGPPMLPSDQNADMLAIAQQAAEGDPEALKQLESMQGNRPDVPLLDHDVQLNNVDGQIKASHLRKIGDMVAANTPEATAVIRQWMNA
ncbi:flagellar basal-body MS-ring/collar protein FliF [Sphingomonas sp.]|uniref:flagellar basal-body MS-ring/collar protein FliF n=1 Tax=Sphingomonas sp. TaxID=28214 RepID=UPI000BD8333A|nr:flagellar basal-body MS-ring/collar protein FliF [Sphingomonas sp.]MBA4761555.1 flagellar M-ring protein FliF [Sphingomonas sp.]OYX51540.1 MAG: flagellar M-ring protein FliF [Sphingomonas sp. 32-66-10]